MILQRNDHTIVTREMDRNPMQCFDTMKRL